jgi:chromosome segregation ATPase
MSPMNKIFTMAVASLSVALFAPVMASAQNSSQQTQPARPQQAQMQPAEPAPAPDATTTEMRTMTAQAQTPASSPQDISSRVNQRKEQQKTKLSNAEKTRITGRCKAAQQQLANATQRFENFDQAYKAKFETYSKKLEAIEPQLQQNGADTTQLKAQLGELGSKYQALTDQINAFKTTVADLQAMDCKADPAGFKASLEAARAEQKAIQAARADLNSFAKGSVMQTLQELKKSVQPAEGETTNE